MLSIQNLRVEYGARVLFTELAFTVLPRERIAFAGHNGAGKSTLMKCIAGIISPSAGRISAPKGTRMGYLPQEGIHVRGRTLWHETESAFGEAVDLRKRIDHLSHELTHLDPRSSPYAEMLDEIGGLELHLEHFDPARIKPRIESVLQGLGFSRDDFQRDCGEFSGGWQMRIAMAKLFLQEPDVLLLDEPTNHLDIDSQSWMEQYLQAYPGAILLISHDRALLDGLCTRTIAFHHGRAEEYSGNFSFYEKESSLRKEVRIRQYKAQQREIEKTKQFIDRFRAQANKASLVQSRVKQLAKIERIEVEEEDAVVDFRFPPPPPSGQLVAKLEQAAKQYDNLTVFENFDFEITRGEKIAIVGPNGAGKSTFCRMITGQESPDSGSHAFGHKVATSFFSQNHADELAPDKTVLQTVEETATRDNVPYVRNLLGCFLFRGDDVFKKIGVLSGGERSRVALVRMLVQPANFLILDEPTNHLDMQSQDVLQRALLDYAGTVMIVSHNRAFLDQLVTKTLEFRPNRPPKLYHGNLSYYLEKTAEEKSASSAPAKSAAPLTAKGNAPASGGNRKDQRRLEAELRQKRIKLLKPLEDELATLEERISGFEQRQASLAGELSTEEVAADPDRFRQTSLALQQTALELEKAYSRWSDLSDEIERVTAKHGL